MKPEIYKDEGYKLMGAAFEVYNEQGMEWRLIILSEFISAPVDQRLSAKISG